MPAPPIAIGGLSSVIPKAHRWQSVGRVFDMRTPLSAALLLLLTGVAPAQDKGKYRDRTGKGGEAQATGKVEAESVAGLRVGAKAIASGDVLDVQYEVTGDLRLAYGRALGDEARNPANAVK